MKTVYKKKTRTNARIGSGATACDINCCITTDGRRLGAKLRCLRHSEEIAAISADEVAPKTWSIIDVIARTVHDLTGSIRPRFEWVGDRSITDTLRQRQYRPAVSGDGHYFEKYGFVCVCEVGASVKRIVFAESTGIQLVVVLATLAL